MNPALLNRDSDHCQPCANFATHDTVYNVHECLAPFDGTHPCDGTVHFCDSCNHDHHSGGYNTCKAGSVACGHPACFAARNGGDESPAGPGGTAAHTVGPYGPITDRSESE